MLGFAPPSRRALLLLTPFLLVAQNPKLTYPPAEKIDHIDAYGDTKVNDPYRWLEDTDSTKTAAWIEAENKLSSSFLSALPGRDKIKARLTELIDYERYPNAFQRNGHYFVFRNDGLQNQNVLYTMDSSNGAPRMLLDPNTLRKDGTAALSGTSVSPDGKLLAYAIAQAGSDWCEWRIRDVATGADRADLIQWTKFTDPAWTPDSKAFYYTRFPQPPPENLLKAQNYNSMIYLHRLGEDQSKDSLIYQRPDHKEWQFGPSLTEDGHYLVLMIFNQDYARNMVFYQDLKAGGTSFVELIPTLAAAYNWLGAKDGAFYFHTTDSAPKGRVISIDPAHADRSQWKEIVAEQPETLDDAEMVGGKLILSYLKDAHSQSKLYSLDGKFIREIQLPGLGKVTWSGARQSDTEIFYQFTSFTSPVSLYLYDLRSEKSSLYRQSKLSFDPALFETKQIFYSSKDGTRVPMFLVYKKGLELNGRNPTLLYGYGGFNIAVTPAFSATTICWLEMGGIYAVANIRGGSEYGEEWHQAGTKLKKQNVFDDFIAAAEWLIANKYTSTPKLAIFGGSNGGLLIGAVLNQRPDLFGAAMPAVGVMDMLRFNKFTVGAAWTGDYGSPENPEEFKALRAYSPLHNIRPGTQYPPTLITTSDHDDRVVPGHSFKYAAALQAAQEGPAPILIRIETRAGHGAGKPTTKIIDESADRWAFLMYALKMTN
jgi:prolyl oligopeptidase